MSQADFLKVKKGKARVVIKTDPNDELPTMELNIELSKWGATKILIYALEIKARERKLYRKHVWKEGA